MTFTRGDFAASGDKGSFYHQHAEVQERIAQQLAGVLPVVSTPLNVLEIGCGTGIFTRILCERYPDAGILALDSSEEMLAVAKAELPKDRDITYVRHDFADFNSDVEFSLLSSSSALHWLRPLDQALEKVSSLVDSTGVFCAATMVDGSLDELYSLRAEIAPVKKSDGAFPSSSDLRVGLESRGFTFEKFFEDSFVEVVSSASVFLQQLKKMGLSRFPGVRNVAHLNRGELSKLIAEYDRKFQVESGGVTVTYRVLFFRAKK